MELGRFSEVGSMRFAGEVKCCTLVWNLNKVGIFHEARGYNFLVVTLTGGAFQMLLQRIS